MPLSFDAQSSGVQSTSTATFQFTHTPIGTPRAIVLIGIWDGTTSPPVFTIDYGGVEMTASVSAVDTATETGFSEIYFLGSGIPTGAQTITVTYTSAITNAFFVCFSFTANADTEIVDSQQTNNNAANPTANLSFPGKTAAVVAGAFSGLAAPGNLTPNNLVSGPSRDFGQQCAVTGYNDFNSGASTVGWTSSSDDMAFVAAAIAEVVAGNTYDDSISAAITTSISKSAAKTAAGSIAAATTAAFTLATQKVTDASVTFPATSGMNLAGLLNILSSASVPVALTVTSSGGKEIDEAVTLTTAVAEAHAADKEIDLSITLSESNGVATASVNTIENSVTFSSAQSIAASSLASAVALLALGVTAGQSATAGSEFDASIVVALTAGFSDSEKLDAAASIAAAATTSYSLQSKLDAAAAIAAAITPTLSPEVQATVFDTISAAVLAGYDSATDGGIDVSISAGVTAGYSHASQLTAFDVIVAAANLGFITSLGSIILAAMALSTSASMSTTVKQDFAGVINLAVTSGAQIAHTLDAEAQAAIATALTQSVTSEALLEAAQTFSTNASISAVGGQIIDTLIGIGVTPAIAQSVAKTLSEAVALGAVTTIASEQIVFAFEESALEAESVETANVLVAQLVESINELVAVDVHEASTVSADDVDSRDALSSTETEATQQLVATEVAEEIALASTETEADPADVAIDVDSSP